MENAATQVGQSPVVEAAGAIKTFRLYSVAQGFPNLRNTESPRELILKYRFRGHGCRNCAFSRSKVARKPAF